MQYNLDNSLIVQKFRFSGGGSLSSTTDYEQLLTDFLSCATCLSGIQVSGTPSVPIEMSTVLLNSSVMSMEFFDRLDEAGNTIECISICLLFDPPCSSLILHPVRPYIPLIAHIPPYTPYTPLYPSIPPYTPLYPTIHPYTHLYTPIHPYTPLYTPIPVYYPLVGDGVVTSGGRVLAATSLGPTMIAALAKSYETVEIGLAFEGKVYRKDIGHDLQKYIR